MPQIWPMNWILLFFLFIMMFIMFLSFTYFIPQVSSFDSSTKSNNASTLNWKW